MREIKIPISSIILLFITIFLGFYTMNIRSEYQDLKIRLDQTDRVAEGKKINDEFVQAYFEYRTLQERFNSIQEYMTAEGYQRIVPNNLEQMDPGSITSEIKDLSSYVKVESDQTLRFYNEFMVSIKYKDSTTEQPVLGKTTLILEEGKWKVSSFELVRVLDETHEDEDEEVD